MKKYCSTLINGIFQGAGLMVGIIVVDAVFWSSRFAEFLDAFSYCIKFIPM